MKKLFLAAAILGMSGLAFGQQQQAASKDSKDSKCSAACMKSCTDGKNCTKPTCTKDGKKASTASASTTATSATATTKTGTNK